jgi:lipopolysaccharide transport system permease protein
MIKKEVVIEKGKVESNYWKDIWAYRELFMVLSWRNVSVKYKQTIIGISWTVIQPILTMVILTFVFGNLASLPTEGTAPYALMVYSALLPWQFFANALNESSNSLTGNAHLISKVYFPRLIVPLSAVLTSMIEFFISFAILCGLMIYFNYMPSIQILLLPVFILLAFLNALGAGLILTALNVKYRDFKIIVPFVIQFGMYISPVAFSSSIVLEKWKLLYSLNPMVGVIEGFRYCILGGESHIYMPGFVISLSLTFMLLWFAIRYFRSTEKVFADLI